MGTFYYPIPHEKVSCGPCASAQMSLPCTRTLNVCLHDATLLKPFLDVNGNEFLPRTFVGTVVDPTVSPSPISFDSGQFRNPEQIIAECDIESVSFLDCNHKALCEKIVRTEENTKYELDCPGSELVFSQVEKGVKSEQKRVNICDILSNCADEICAALETAPGFGDKVRALVDVCGELTSCGAQICQLVISNCGTSSVVGNAANGQQTVTLTHNDGSEEVFCQGPSSFRGATDCGSIGVGSDRMVRGVSWNGKELIIDAAPEHDFETIGISDLAGPNVDITSPAGRVLLNQTDAIDVCNETCREMKMVFCGQAVGQAVFGAGGVWRASTEANIGGTVITSELQYGIFPGLTGLPVVLLPDVEFLVPPQSCVSVQYSFFIETLVPSAEPSSFLGARAISFIAKGGTVS